MGKLSKEQAAAMRHALGLDRKAKSYRNRYHAAVGSPVAEMWTDLVSLGYAALVHVESGLILFTVTPAGRAALESKEPGNG
jgi:hypothetical protein